MVRVKNVLGLEFEGVTGKLVLAILLSYAVVSIVGGALLAIEGEYLAAILSILVPSYTRALFLFHFRIFKIMLVPQEFVIEAIPPFWELVTSIFVHANLIHLLFNTIALKILGSRFEDILGAKRMAATFFIGGVIANLATIGYGLGVERIGASVGASGALFSIAGAIAFIEYTLYRSYQSIWWIFLIFIVSSTPFLVGSSINVVAHATGLLYGIIIGVYYGERLKRWYRYRRVYW